MRLGAVELFKPHYMGKAANLDRGVDCVKVYPIAIGNFREQVQPCGSIIVPSPSATRKIVVAISRWDVDRGKWGPFEDKTDEFTKDLQSRSFWWEMWETYGEKRNGPDWEWTCVLTTAAKLIPADEYEQGSFLFDEWKAMFDKACADHNEAQHRFQVAKDNLVVNVRQWTKGSGIDVQCYGMSWSVPADEIRDSDRDFGLDDISFNNDIDIQTALNCFVKRRRMTRAVANQFPFEGKAKVVTIAELESFIGKHPAKLDALASEYFAAARDEMITNAEEQRLGTCNPRYL